jgi:hypothetical protein
MQSAPEAVRRLLQARLDQADAIEVPETTPVRPAPADGLTRSAPLASASPLAQLNQHVAQTTGTSAHARSELRSARAFRETWSRICAEEEVTDAVQRGPDNAGPLNSHMLVLRTLGVLRTLSPAYLRHFMAHSDTLLWLEQVGGRPRLPAGKANLARRKP